MWVLIILFICSIALYFYTRYCRLKIELNNEEIEAFESEESLTFGEKLKKHYDLKIVYLSAADAKEIFNSSNEYLQNMNQVNLAARECDNLEALYNKYLNALDDISDIEKEKINVFIWSFLQSINENNVNYCKYITYWLKTIKFAKGKNWLESGMPHTIANVIIMDSNWYNVPRQSTLIHELAHVHQRMKFFEFEDLYKQLNYIYHNKPIKGMESYYNLNRNNPDGTSPFWLWKDSNNNYWWIGAVFKTISPSNVTDVDYIAIKLDRGSDGTLYNLTKIPNKLSSFNDFNNYFGINNNNYHPNEMSAKYMELYLNDVLKSGDRLQYANAKGYNIFKNYFRDLCDKYYSFA